MRPVDRGPWPPGANGLPIQFAHYPDAKPALIDQLDRYCSYCELPLVNAATVEHKEPKTLRRDLEKMWCNLLLACTYCQGCKGHTPISLNEYLWPDQDNTLRAFVYWEQFVRIAPELDDDARERAEKTQHLVGLDKVPGAQREPSRNDTRWEHRQEVWGIAQQQKKYLQASDTEENRLRIITMAKHTGHFSIWMTVFGEDVDMRRRLVVDAFRGTSKACFDGEYRVCTRPGGAI